MGDPVLGFGERLALGCTHPSLCSPEGLQLRRKPDLSTDLCIVGLGPLRAIRRGWGRFIWGVQAGGSLLLTTPLSRAGEPPSRFISPSQYLPTPHPLTGLRSLRVGGPRRLAPGSLASE